MTDYGDQPDPQRVRLYLCIFEPSSLEEVAEAVSAATEDETHVYVERIGRAYRWSLVHPGGAYPLLRIAARFLRIDYHRIVIGSRKVAAGVWIVREDSAEVGRPDAWAILYFNKPTRRMDVKQTIQFALEPR